MNFKSKLNQYEQSIKQILFAPIFFAFLTTSVIFGWATTSQAQEIAPQCFATAAQNPASSVPVEDFKSAAQLMVNQLLTKGYRNFGQLNLVKFTQEIQQTHVRYFPALRFTQTDGSERQSACWSLEGSARTVNVSLWMWARTDAQMRAVIAMHEFLGPAQFNDQDYQLSSAMALLAQAETAGLIEPEQLPALNGARKITSFNASVGKLGRQALALGGGGVIGVGGGGDWLAATAKLAFLKVGLKSLQRARTPAERARAIQEILDGQTGWTVEVQWR